MTINQTDEENGLTGSHLGFGDLNTGKMLWQAEQTSKFFTPEPERESVKQEMTDKKQDMHKPMSFIDNGAVTEGINFG